jgi:hypothetical protein
MMTSTYRVPNKGVGTKKAYFPRRRRRLSVIWVYMAYLTLTSDLIPHLIWFFSFMS